VYVADTENNRVQEFSATGAYITQWGSKGSENGQLKEPDGIAVGPYGNVYIADTGNNRVQEWGTSDPLGFQSKWGSAGSGNGEFNSAFGVAVAADGDVYVTDNGNDRVQEFSAAGTYITQWGSKGTGNGQFNELGGVAVAADGDVYVVDYGNDRVQEFSAAGTYITRWGSKGSENGQLKEPDGIAIAPDWNVYAVDTGNDRVQEWGPTSENAHDTQTVYYSAAANPTAPACGGHPEWANLPCQTQPAVQPPDGRELPVVTDTYNMWDEPEAITETVDSTTRTKTETYNAAGRLEKALSAPRWAPRCRA
jgi:DNA-binding beta-propeller fold protein YncE